MYGEYAPIALFAYARLEHLRLTVNSLLANPECKNSALYVFCDGPAYEGRRPQVEAVRTYVDSIEGFASVTRIYRDENFGLARSIISGVSDVLGQHGTVIVMEDDLVVSPYFLKFMNEGLMLYRDDQQVASVHGYIFPVGQGLSETFFLRGAECWGWATWTRAWQCFNADGRALLEGLQRQGLTEDFDLGGAYPYTDMLRKQIAGKNNSWAIRWRASCYLKGMLTLYPGRSLVDNIGMDGSGDHCSPTNVFAQQIADRPVTITKQPLVEDLPAKKAIADFLRRQSSLYARGRRLAARLMTRCGVSWRKQAHVGHL